jgi:hypothetical protein
VAALILVLAYPMFAYINSAPSLSTLLVFQLVFGTLIAAYTGPILAAFSELFPAKVLSTGLSVAYNLAVTIFGGFLVLHHLADRRHRQHHGPGLLRDDRCRHQLRRHPLRA